MERHTCCPIPQEPSASLRAWRGVPRRNNRNTLRRRCDIMGFQGTNEGWSQLQTLPVLRYRRREARLKRQVLCEQQGVAHGNIGRSETARHRYACFLTTGSNVRKRARGHFIITLSACRHEMAHEKAFGFAQSFLGEETDFALFTGSAMRPRSCRRVWSRSARAPGHG